MSRAKKILSEANLSKTESDIMKELGDSLKDRGTALVSIECISNSLSYIAAGKLVDKGLIVYKDSTSQAVQQYGAYGKRQVGSFKTARWRNYTLTNSGKEFVKHDPTQLPSSTVLFLSGFEKFSGLTIKEFNALQGYKPSLPGWITSDMSNWENKTIAEFMAKHTEMVLAGKW